MKSKKGGIVDENLIGTIMAVAGVFLLLVLLFNLFAPSFDRTDKTAESYFKTLNRAIETADSGGNGEFFMMDEGDNKLEFYLTYFGSIASFKEDRIFARSKEGEKIICVCYWKGSGNSVCDYCEELKLPVKYVSVKEADEGNPQITTGKISPWVIRENERIIITKKEGYYEFAKI